MVHSSTDARQTAERGFLPPQDDAERLLMRRMEELAGIALQRGVPRTSLFLSDREQVLAEAAMHRAQCRCWRFDGGFPQAERRVLCIEPEDTKAEGAVCCVRIDCRLVPGAVAPQHKDYLGSLTGFGLGREALGDILLPEQQPGTAYVFALKSAAQAISAQLDRIGSFAVTVQDVPAGEVPVFPEKERRVQTATVSSLRLDAVLAAMLHCSRGQAAELIEAGRVEINHVTADSAHAAVYCGDLFSVRGKGRYQLTELPGKSKKERYILSYFQY